VGAMNTRSTLGTADDVMTSYSSKGPTNIDHLVKPDLVAPGNRVLSLRSYGSTLDTLYPVNEVPDSALTSTQLALPSFNYYQLSGTSISAAMVTGAVAVLLEQNPKLMPDQVKARLMRTAAKWAAKSVTVVDPLTGIGYLVENDVFTVGAGTLNLPAALADTQSSKGSAASPLATYSASTGSTAISSVNAIWGSNAIWGYNAIWVSNGIWGTNAIWGSNAIWGANAIWGSNAIWGAGTPAGEAAAIAIMGEN